MKNLTERNFQHFLFLHIRRLTLINVLALLLFGFLKIREATALSKHKLVRLLKSKNNKDKINAIQYIGGMGKRSIPFVPYLFPLLKSYPLRKSVIKSIAKLYPHVEKLVVNFGRKGNTSDKIETTFIIAFAGLKAGISTEILLLGYMLHKYRTVRLNAGWALSKIKIKRKKTIDSIISILQKEKVSSIRMNILGILSMNPRYSSAHLKLIVQEFSNSKKSERQIVLYLIYRVHKTPPLFLVLQMIQQTKDPKVKHSLASYIHLISTSPGYWRLYLYSKNIKKEEYVSALRYLKQQLQNKNTQPIKQLIKRLQMYCKNCGKSID